MMFLWTLLVSLCIEYTFLTNPPEAQACMDQDMHVQLRTSTATRPQLAGVFTTKNRVEWCRESGELHLYSHGVQKYSFPTVSYTSDERPLAGMGPMHQWTKSKGGNAFRCPRDALASNRVSGVSLSAYLCHRCRPNG